MFAFKKVAALQAFYNSATARPWLPALLILTSFIGVCATALVSGTPFEADSITGVLKALLETGAAAYLISFGYQQLLA